MCEQLKVKWWIKCEFCKNRRRHEVLIILSEVSEIDEISGLKKSNIGHVNKD